MGFKTIRFSILSAHNVLQVPHRLGNIIIISFATQPENEKFEKMKNGNYN